MAGIFEPKLLATTLGSLPHRDVVRATALVLGYTPEIPAWVQFPRLGESMMKQFNDGLPGLTLGENGMVYVNTQEADFEESLADFYTLYLSATEDLDDEALEAFAISPDQAVGFYELLRQLPAHETRPMAIKGQVTGPFTLGTNLTDQDFRAIYYDERLRDVVVKLVGLKALWQVHRLREVCPRVIVFLDEPGLVAFGSALYISVSREDIIKDVNEVAAAVHEDGALVGVHCEENTDWSLLMQCDLDILDFDAYGHLHNLLLYPRELQRFLARGGSLGWGLVPTLDREAAAKATVEDLVDRFEKGLDELSDKGIDRDLLIRRALLTPSCGAGGLPEDLAERVLVTLHNLSATLRTKYGFGE
ncbi:MAG: uroporphyrinogen decarboxylase/cobalamine-independent methonine synthase family protein [Chloroflexota bacterium]